MEILTLAWCWTCRRRHYEQWSDRIEMVSVKGGDHTTPTSSSRRGDVEFWPN
jgi:hypothetical protein